MAVTPLISVPLDPLTFSWPACIALSGSVACVLVVDVRWLVVGMVMVMCYGGRSVCLCVCVCVRV